MYTLYPLYTAFEDFIVMEALRPQTFSGCLANGVIAPLAPVSGRFRAAGHALGMGLRHSPRNLGSTAEIRLGECHVSKLHFYTRCVVVPKILMGPGDSPLERIAGRPLRDLHVISHLQREERNLSHLSRVHWVILSYQQLPV